MQSSLLFFMDLVNHGGKAGLAHLPERERGAGADDFVGIREAAGEGIKRRFPDPAECLGEITPQLFCASAVKSGPTV